MPFQSLLKKHVVPLEYERNTAVDYASQLLTAYNEFSEADPISGRRLISDRIGVELRLSAQTMDPKDEVEAELKGRINADIARNDLTDLMREFLERVKSGEEVRPVEVPPSNSAVGRLKP